MNKKAPNNVSALDLLYIIFWAGVVMGIVYWLWPLVMGVLTVAINFEELVALH